MKSINTPRNGDVIAQPPADPARDALRKLAEACAESQLCSRSVEYDGRWQLRIWDPSVQGAAVQVDARVIDGVAHYTRQGKLIASAADMSVAVSAIRSRLRVRM